MAGARASVTVLPLRLGGGGGGGPAVAGLRAAGLFAALAQQQTSRVGRGGQAERATGLPPPVVSRRDGERRFLVHDMRRTHARDVRPPAPTPPIGSRDEVSTRSPKGAVLSHPRRHACDGPADTVDAPQPVPRGPDFASRLREQTPRADFSCDAFR